MDSHSRPISPIPNPSSSSPIMPTISLSPTTSLAPGDSGSEDELSIADEALGGSWIPVDDFSSVPSSILGSNNSVLDSSSSDEGEGVTDWIPETDDEESANGDHEDPVHFEPPPIFSHLASHVQHPSNTALSSSESYIDGEASGSSFFGSEGTINQSGIRLVLPDPNSSFLDLDSTPSHSYQDIKIQPPVHVAGQSFREGGQPKDTIPFLRDAIISGRRFDKYNAYGEKSTGVDEAWLRESRFYATVRDDGHDSDSEDIVAGGVKSQSGDQKATNETWQKTYRKARASKVEGSMKEKDAFGRVNRLRNLRAQKVDLKEMTATWPFKVALATLISLALVGTIGPGFNLSLLKGKKPIPPVVSQSSSAPTNPGPEVGKTLSIWDRLSLSPVPVTSTWSEPSIKPTASISDMSLIRQALSVLSTDNQGTPNVPEPSMTKSVPSDSYVGGGSNTAAVRTRIRKAGIKDSARGCCSLAIRNKDTEISISLFGNSYREQPVADIVKNWSRKAFRVKNDRNTASSKVETIKTVCHCGPTQQFKLGLSDSTANRSLAAIIDLVNSKVAQALVPVVMALQKEYQDLINLSKDLYNTTLSISKSVIKRATEGAAVTRRYWSGMINTADLDIALRNSHLGLANVANETRVHAWKSLLQARRGLDRLVDEYQSYTMGVKSDRLPPERIEGKGSAPMPFGTKFRSRLRSRFHPTGSSMATDRKWKEDARHSYKAQWGRRLHDSTSCQGKKKERAKMAFEARKSNKRSKINGLMDMIHHGALQLIR